jgi:hypothetical protein
MLFIIVGKSGEYNSMQLKKIVLTKLRAGSIVIFH